ncbi:uncharacterized protein LOC123227705 isoform X2 [Mangifera indica]|uniref:uncharacterized protein LOC123227705 isoform X2 n=1 Tax=Mangifera indica TaxID=29780 RepID=UPI001CF998F3|nr:uncharacterized protein LOC123227705 isoform X2 [Mangifera indica]
MAQNGRVHPNCVNASNPYHECGMYCLEKIAQGQGKKEKTKSDKDNGIKEVAVTKKKDERRKVHPDCAKASNPYHECADYCMNRNGELLGVKKEPGSWSFGRKKKAYASQPNSPRDVSFGSIDPDARNTQPKHNPKKKADSEKYQSFPSEQYSSEIYPQDNSFSEEQDKSTQSIPPSGNIMMNSRSKDPPKEIVPADDELPATQEYYQKRQASPQAGDIGEDIARSTVESRNFGFLDINDVEKDSDDDDAESVISDSCVSVGKYHVKASVSSILQTILDRYGDIAANCQLKSNSMRAYYLECLCAVVQELQATSFMQITKAKVKEMLAVVKDVESAQIDVDWLRNILNDISEAIELTARHETIERAKVTCDNLLVSTRKELESQMKDLALKEEEYEAAKAGVAETKTHLLELESESAELEKTIESTRSKVEKFKRKSLADYLQNKNF